MKRNLRNLLFTIPGLVIGAVGASSCDKRGDGADPDRQPREEVCGPCGEIATGDFSISGDATLDGFFHAVGTLQTRDGQHQGGLRGNIMALAAVYGIDASGDITPRSSARSPRPIDGRRHGQRRWRRSRFATSRPAVQGRREPRGPGGGELRGQGQLRRQGRRRARSRSSAKAECKGGCDAECTGSAECAVDAPSVSCTGTCEGSCELDVAAKCTGTCHGTCSGNCSAKDAQRELRRYLRRGLQGKLRVRSAAAKCSGHLQRQVRVEVRRRQVRRRRPSAAAPATARAPVRCTGTATPPSASAKCDASADCQASRRPLRRSASLVCTPPELDHRLQAQGDRDRQRERAGDVRRAPVGSQGTRRRHPPGCAKLQLLVDGRATQRSCSSPLTGRRTSRASPRSTRSRSSTIPLGRIDCVGPCLQGRRSGSGEVIGTFTDTLTAQAKFVGYITTGA